MKKQKNRRDFIPIKCYYLNSEGKTFIARMNLLCFTSVTELINDHCALKNKEMGIEAVTDYSFDEIVCLLEDNFGEDILDITEGSGLRSLVCHYLFFENEKCW